MRHTAHLSRQSSHAAVHDDVGKAVGRHGCSDADLYVPGRTGFLLHP